jgi:hypothetical protein
MLKRLRENVRRKIPQLWRNNSWFLHHDNAPAHASLLIRDFLANTNTTVLPQPPCSHGLAPTDSFFHFERTTISEESRDYGKLADGATRDPEKCVAGLFPVIVKALGALYQCRRGVL